MKYPLSLLLALVFLTAAAPAAQALTIAPARMEINGDPGQTISGEFTLVNDQQNTITFYSSTANFESSGDSGTPSFTDSSKDLASWTSLQPEVTLTKGETVKIPFTVKIPSDADAGGHFATIFLSTNPNNPEEGQVSIGAKIGLLVLLRVSGDIREGGGVTYFGTIDNQRFFTSLPIDLQYKFNNTGNDRVNPYGDVVIKNTLFLTAAKLPANKSEGNVLPGSTRRFTVEWGEPSQNGAKPVGFFKNASYEAKHFAFGMYTAKLSLQYGSSGRAEASKVFFVFPWQLLLLVSAVLIPVIYLLRVLLIGYNRRIIAKARAIDLV